MRKGKQHWYVGEIIKSKHWYVDEIIKSKHWYVGEIIKSTFGHDTYEVISAINGKEKFKDDYPKGYTKPKGIVWYYEIRNCDNGCIYKFNRSQVKDDGWFELVTPVEERLWNL